MKGKEEKRERRREAGIVGLARKGCGRVGWIEWLCKEEDDRQGRRGEREDEEFLVFLGEGKGKCCSEKWRRIDVIHVQCVEIRFAIRGILACGKCDPVVV